jgi:XTP/dITP diphosphohydrolase
MTLQLVLATRNAGKLAELRRILSELDVELLSAADVGLPDVTEDGDTFAENARKKARAGVEACGLPCVADDSGLVVDALGGDPGVRSARYAGEHGDDEANLRLVLERMANVTDPAERTARFVCVAALAAPDGREWAVEGVLEGRLIASRRGDGGFGYDPIFVPTDDDRTTAEMSPEEKDAISHRGQAFRAIRPAVAQLQGA